MATKNFLFVNKLVNAKIFEEVKNLLLSEAKKSNRGANLFPSKQKTFREIFYYYF